MSEASSGPIDVDDATKLGAQDEKQCVEPSHDLYLSGALLPDGIDLLGTPSQTNEASLSEPSFKESVAQEPNEPTTSSVAEAIADSSRQLILPQNDHQAPTPITTTNEKPIVWSDGRTIPPELRHQSSGESHAPSTDNLSDIPRKTIDVSLSDQTFKFTADQLKSPEKLGEGSFGAVYKVTVNPSTGFSIAVKCVRITNGEERWRKLQKELTTLQQVALGNRSPHIVCFYGALLNPPGAEVCFLTELMAMNLESACKVLHRRHDFSPDLLDLFLRRLSYNVVSVLQFMSGHGLSHHDIKPENILINEQGQLKLCDFGESDVTVNGTTDRTDRPGTVRYWPPEYTRRPVRCSSVKADLWALGITLLQMIMGQHPFSEGKGEFDIELSLRKYKPTIPWTIISPDLGEFISYLFQLRTDVDGRVFSEILRSPYLAHMDSSPSDEERNLFKWIIQQHKHDTAN